MGILVPQDYVYLDWAATTPLCAEAAEAMEPYLRTGLDNLALGANANSLHAPGRAAFEAMELARKQIAHDLGASRPNEIVFTSGATESDNMALIGIARAARDVRRAKLGKGFSARIVATSIEHEAVLKPAAALEHEGFAVTYVNPDARGFIDPDAFEAALGDDVVLASVQMANSEVGSIQPIAELARRAHAQGALFHTDAVQALGKTPLDVASLGVDAASFSAHKICGPKGVGALYLKARTPFAPLVVGGGQEDGRRSGTQNVCGIAGFAAAVHAAVGMCATESERLRALRDSLYTALADMEGIRPTLAIDAGDERYLPNIVHASADVLESETMVLRLDMMGFGVSGGSACSSHSLEPSHVLKALGIRPDQAYRALRVSMGRLTDKRDIEAFVAALRECVS